MGYGLWASWDAAKGRDLTHGAPEALPDQLIAHGS